MLDLDAEARVREILDHLARLQNLHLAGRSGLFTYTSLHDLLFAGHQLVSQLADRATQGVASAATDHPRGRVRRA